MVRPSTQQTVDRILGTAAILGLSIVLVRRLLLSSQNSSHHHYYHHHTPPRRRRKQQQFEDENINNNNNQTRWRWWGNCYWLWPGGSGIGGMPALQKRRDHHENTRKDDRMDEVDNDKRMHEHLGSCHCGSIQFLVSREKKNL